LSTRRLPMPGRHYGHSLLHRPRRSLVEAAPRKRTKTPQLSLVTV
jgi:hypothetical protein